MMIVAFGSGRSIIFAGVPGFFPIYAPETRLPLNTQPGFATD